MCTGHMRIMSNITTKTAISILTPFEPSDDFLYFLFGQFMIKCGKTGQRPIPTSDFKMFSQVLSDRMEVFTILQSEGVFEVFLSVEGWSLFFSLHEVFIFERYL